MKSKGKIKKIRVNLLSRNQPKLKTKISEEQIKLISVNLLFPDPKELKIKRFKLKEKKYMESMFPQKTLSEKLKDRAKTPAKWWFPILPIKINRDEDERKRQHEETSRTVRRAMLGLTALCLFCVLALSAGDVKLLTTNAAIKLPFANVEVDFKTFLVTAPIMLTGLLIYLHIFFGHLRLIDKPEEGSQLPVLFNLPYRNAQLLSLFMLYWQAPLVLAFFYWKSIPQPNAATPFFVLLFTTFFMVFLQIRRRKAEYRYQNRYLWFLLIYLIFVFIDKSIVLFQGKPVSNSFLGEHVKIYKVKILYPLLTFPFARELQLAGADLSKSNLEGFNLNHADLRNANLSQAQISGAFLEKADLQGAIMTGVVARWSQFTGADLSHAVIEGANLEAAVFNNANFYSAKLKGANLRRAQFRRAVLVNASLVETDMRDADLNHANLFKADLTGAKLDRSILENTILKKERSSPNAPKQKQKKSKRGK